MKKLSIKTDKEMGIMAEGGKLLAKIREATVKSIRPGMTTAEIDRVAERMILDSGGEASFKMVPGYKHATCINVNEEVVHGIPGSRKVGEGDVVGVDLGLFYKGFHTDTSTTILVPTKNVDKETVKFLDTGRSGLRKAIEAARPGKRVWDLSEAMQKTVEKRGYSVVRALTGHGIGRELHEEPAIPCFTVGSYPRSVKLEAGMVIAIEIMYNLGGFEVVYKNDDGWTIASADGKISGLFEETVAITKTGPVVLTAYQE